MVLSFPRQSERCWGDARILDLKIPVSPRNSYLAHIRHPGNLGSGDPSGRHEISHYPTAPEDKDMAVFLGGGRDGGRKGPLDPSGSPYYVWWLHSQPELPFPIINNSVSFSSGSQQRWPGTPECVSLLGTNPQERRRRIPKNGNKGASFIIKFLKFPVSVRVFPGKWAVIGYENLVRYQANCRSDSQTMHPQFGMERTRLMLVKGVLEHSKGKAFNLPKAAEPREGFPVPSSLFPCRILGVSIGNAASLSKRGLTRIP